MARRRYQPSTVAGLHKAEKNAKAELHKVVAKKIAEVRTKEPVRRRKTIKKAQPIIEPKILSASERRLDALRRGRETMAMRRRAKELL